MQIPRVLPTKIGSCQNPTTQQIEMPVETSLQQPVHSPNDSLSNHPLFPSPCTEQKSGWTQTTSFLAVGIGIYFSSIDPAWANTHEENQRYWLSVAAGVLALLGFCYLVYGFLKSRPTKNPDTSKIDTNTIPSEEFLMEAAPTQIIPPDSLELSATTKEAAFGRPGENPERLRISSFTSMDQISNPASAITNTGPAYQPAPSHVGELIPEDPTSGSFDALSIIPSSRPPEMTIDFSQPEPLKKK